MFVDVQVKILGDIPNLVEKQNQINTALNEMFNGEYYNFKIQFYESKLIRTVENVFENDMRSGIDVVISPKILLTEEMFQELNASDYLEIYVPNALKRFKLVKNDTVINVPENYQDELTYLLDGWTKEYVYEEDIDVTFSGTLNSKTITTGAKETSGDIEIKRINLDATEVGYFDVTNSILYLQDLNTELDPFADDYIEVSYDTGMNVKLLKNAFLQLGDVTYV